MPVVVTGGGTYSPGAMQANELIRAVLDYVQGTDDSHLRDVAKRELNLAIDEINTHNWRRLIVRQDITTVAGTAEYDLDATFKEPVRAALYDGSDIRIRLSYMDWATFLAELDFRTGSSPIETYSIDHENRLLVLSSTPDASYVAQYDTLKLWYYKRLVYLTDDGSVHGGPPEFNQFLVWKARGSMAAVRGDMGSSDAADSRAYRIFRNLRVNDGLASTDWE